MDFNKLLNQVLGAASQAAQDKSLLKKAAGGAAAAGLASLLLGKKNSKKLLKAGSMAALGALAYHAYQKWQEKTPPNTPAAAPLALPAFEPQGEAAERAGRLLLRTMIAAASADGRIDEAERRLIEQESSQIGGDAAWLAQEWQHPAAVEDLAAEIGEDSALAAEVYLAARMVCGDLARQEIVFLSRLAHALQLPQGLAEELEKQAGF